MKILAIDTSALVATAALCDDEKLIAVYSQKAGMTHSQTMLPIIKNIMDNTETNIDDVDMIAVSEGPGSFTGIRIGIATVKGLAFGKNKICIGVSTLEAMARTIADFCTDAIICPVMDARRNQLYNAVFEMRGGKLLRLTEDRMIEAPVLAKELDAMDRPVYFVGDGYDIMAKMKLSYQRETPVACRWQNGYGVAMAALALYNNTEDKSVFTDRMLRPEYLRLPQAERELKEKEAQKA
jgi:tRNA threonylcarbamoyladenosine biosynthesis protein TsaB